MISIVVPVGLVLAGVGAIAMVEAVGGVAEIPSTSPGASAPSDPRRRLPVGETKIAWELDIDDYFVSGVDLASHSIALRDVSVSSNEVSRIEVVDTSAKGFVRWRQDEDADWLVNYDGTLSTVDGLAFLDGTAASNPFFSVSAVRLADGRRVWQSPPEAGWGKRLIEDVLVLNTDTTVTAIDARTGTQRWKWMAEESCGYGPRFGARGPQAVIVGCGSSVQQLSLSDGSASWTWSTPDDCSVNSTSATESVTAIMLACKPARQQLVVVDSRTGKEKWKRPVPWNPDAADPADPNRGAAGVSTFVVGDTTILEVVGDDDTQQFDAQTGTDVPLSREHSVSSTVAAVADKAVYQDSAHQWVTFAAVDPRDGKTAWRRELPLDTEGLRAYQTVPQKSAGNMLYLLGSVRGMWPAVVTLIDGRTGETTSTATEWSGGQLVATGQDGTLYANVVDAGKRLLVAFQIVGQGTGFLGSAVRAEDWPDACRLLSVSQYRSAFDAPPVVKPISLNAPGATLKAPPQCRYLPAAIDGTEVAVHVTWVAEAADLAAVIAKDQSLMVRPGVAKTIGAGRHRAWRSNETNTGVDKLPHTLLSFSVGRCVATVTTIGNQQPLLTIGGEVADSLADPAISPGCAA